MNRRPDPIEPEFFSEYFNVADELSDPKTALDDLDPVHVAEARIAGFRLNLPWPPDLAAAEEFRLDLYERQRHLNGPGQRNDDLVTVEMQRSEARLLLLALGTHRDAALELVGEKLRSEASYSALADAVDLIAHKLRTAADRDGVAIAKRRNR